MPTRTENEKWFVGWQGVCLVAITYIYFLIFAQFGFLKRLADLGIAGGQLKLIMGAMAAGGILTSLLAPQLEGRWQPVRRLQSGFLGCAAGAVLTWLPLNLVNGTAVSLLIGTALGLLTVTLVTHLNLWIGTRQPLLKIGLGVGSAYFVCNYPRLFEASPAAMALVAALLCLGGTVLATRSFDQTSTISPPLVSGPIPSFWLVLGCFTALVWLDSAAFYIIQNTPALKAGTWAGSRRLWLNGGVHFLAALAAGLMLNRGRLSATLSLAFAALGSACLLLSEPARAALASVCYPAGVSLYSVALVAYPAYLAVTISARDRARVGGRLYAVAGWLGSGLGIGMGENLRRIPPAFVLAASLLFFLPWFWRWVRQRPREVFTTVVLLLAALGWQTISSPPTRPAPARAADTLVSFGREVYRSEGCLHCHSQYVRPHSKDEIMWGPAENVDVRRAEQPPLIGNRRQGPDLTEVGNRRSVLWLRAHFMHPAWLSHNSPMPSYAGLFADDRGDALIAYLASLGGTNIYARLEITQTQWHLSDTAITTAQSLDGTALLRAYCATCHAADGLARQKWGSSFKRLPPDFVTGPFAYAPLGMPADWRLQRLAQIIKFGLPETDMPGHEYLPDQEIAALATAIIRLGQTNQPGKLAEQK